MRSTTKFLLLCLSTASIRAAPLAQNSNARSCNPDGSIVCGSGGTSFSICNFGVLVPMGQVAAGTTCKNGELVALDAPQSMVPPTNQNTMPEPTEVESSGPSPTDDSNTSSTEAPSNQPVVDPSVPMITSTSTITTEIRVQQTSVIMVTVQEDSTAVESSVVVPTSVPSTGGIQITPDMILQIGPSSASCAGKAEDQCGTAQEAAPFINDSFAKYGINTVSEAAAILSLMMFESGNFEFNTNQYPGRPGQGTKAMMMPEFVVQYAQTFGSTDDIQPGLNKETIKTASDTVKTQVLNRVLSDDRTYASAAWFYSTCPESVKSGLRAGPSTEAWTAYIAQCVQTPATDDRKAVFDAAVAAISASS